MKSHDARGRPAWSYAWLPMALCCLVPISSRARALVDPELELRLERNGEVEILVAFEGRQDWSGLEVALPRSERAAAVVTSLRTRAALSQADLLRLLEALGIEHRSYHVANVVWARPRSRAELRRIAATQGVRHVYANESSSAGALPSTAGAKTMGSWGVERIGAAEAWASGHRGAGVVVGSIDTGVRWTHAALLDGYRGWSDGTAEHDYNWHDAVRHDGFPCGADSPAPCDPTDHGTPTIAAAVGRSTEFAGEIGVAPEAEWIACRAIDRFGAGSPASYLECLEFMLAPYPVGGSPLEGDPDLAPDVIVNSYTCRSCDHGLLQEAFGSLEAAGILAVAAAGNSGPDCGSIALAPAVLREVFTVGAVNGLDEVAGLSSRGPAARTALTKPDLVAPGVSIQSASGRGDERHDSYSGTSLATPLVAGTAALALSAHPPLREDLPRLRALLERTSIVPSDRRQACSFSFEQRPNDNWGWGRVDAALAVRHAASPETELSCSDGRDDDGDRLADCVDPDCAGAPDCPGESSCSNGIDDDGNGVVDCWDASCVTHPACPVIAASSSLSLQELALQPVANLFDPACRQARWRICPEGLSVGTEFRNPLVGEGLATGVDSLTCYQHSAGFPDWRLQREGEDLVLSR